MAGFFKVMRSDATRELLRDPNAFTLLAGIAHRAKWTTGLSVHNLDQGQALITKEIRIRGIVEFRNTYVGHIWNRRTNRPIEDVEIDAAVSRIQRDDEVGFLAWVYKPRNDVFPETVVSIISRTHTLMVTDIRVRS